MDRDFSKPKSRISKIWPESRFSRNFDPNRFFQKPKSRNNFSKSIFQTFKKLRKNLRDFSILPKNRDFRKFRPKSRFSKIVTEILQKNWFQISLTQWVLKILKMRILKKKFHQNRDFWQFWPKSRFSKLLTKIEIWQKFWAMSRFFENFD